VAVDEERMLQLQGKTQEPPQLVQTLLDSKQQLRF
jgi:hypothetical protein